MEKSGGGGGGSIGDDADDEDGGRAVHRSRRPPREGVEEVFLTSSLLPRRTANTAVQGAGRGRAKGELMKKRLGHTIFKPHDDVNRVARPIMPLVLDGAQRAHQVENVAGALIIPAAGSGVRKSV